MRDNADEVTQSLWKEYKSSESREAEDRLIRHYFWMVMKKVRHYVSKQNGSANSSFDKDLLMEGAMNGLWEAIREYNFESEVPFIIYARERITVRIKDRIRELGNIPRLTYTREQKYNQARLELISDGLNVDEETIGKKLGLTQRMFIDHIKGRRFYYDSQSLDGLIGSSGDRKTGALLEFIAGNSSAPYQNIEREDFFNFLCQSLNQTQRDLLKLYYLQGKTNKQISRCLDLSKSRISQLHKEVVKLLKEKFVHRREEFLQK